MVTTLYVYAEIWNLPRPKEDMHGAVEHGKPPQAAALILKKKEDMNVLMIVEIKPSNIEYQHLDG